MDAYTNRSHVIPEASGVKRFGWFHSGNLCSAPKSDPRLSRGTLVNLQPVNLQPVNQQSVNLQPLNLQRCAPVLPLQAVTLTAEPTNETKPVKARKRKPVKASNRAPSKASKPKKWKKSKKLKGHSTPEAKREKMDLSIDVDGTKFDPSMVPSPFCSCTGTARSCYKWGANGWQSSCYTINVSEYPLPLSPKRPGVRIAGRKMSNGPYLKLILKMAAEGLDLTRAIDLKEHWARHGTNKFVTIK